MWVDTNDVYNNVQQYVNKASYNKAIATQLHHTANKARTDIFNSGKNHKPLDLEKNLIQTS